MSSVAVAVAVAMTGVVLDVDVCNATTLAILTDGLVLVRRLGELGDDVP